MRDEIIKPFLQLVRLGLGKSRDTKIFDEADSFLQDRSRAMRSWEISSVNEMLTWMENHPYPFVCTTNLMETL